MTVISEKTGLCMWRLGNTMQNLKQHLYKLKQIKTLTVIQ